MISGNGQTVRSPRAANLAEPDQCASHWKTRVIVAALAAIGLFIASYLAVYQSGLIHQVWEPFFGQGSDRVLHSFVSETLPVPDAVVGAVGYAVEFVTTVSGGAERWRLRPKLVLFYGLVVAGLAVAGVALVALQAFVLHAFCTFCLLSAIISLVVAFLARDEVFASLKLLYEKRKTY